MNKFSVLILLTYIFVGNVFASNEPEAKKEHDWKLVVSNSDGSNYIDWNNLKRDEDFVYFWELVDFSSPQKGTMSIKAYRKADCNEDRVKSLQLIAYSEKMGTGEGFDGTKYPIDWQSVPEASIAATSILQVCNITFLIREYRKSMKK